MKKDIPYKEAVDAISDEGWELAEKFHEVYERLASTFGYATRAESAKPWGEVPLRNKQLMAATCTEILAKILAPVSSQAPAPQKDEIAE